ncbi:dicarboxylate transport [Pseudomonas sp. SJZ079]|uniref:intermembrane phospholipid transport protein YdbH family protein n=1 Tax=Pseudomonas sp. SJZ079 TaxID=2572887 RepID=UPI001199AE3D|nr:YdbH domain-containing protein [Pseudomonas sp. SJZ079]TWC38543.1 dicarboxylate transport [Pseudomonas sp. SJZ079]
MISRRAWLRIISVFVLLLLLSGYAYLSWARLLERYAIRQLDWQGPSLSFEGITLAHLTLRQQDSSGGLLVQAEQLRLAWRSFSFAPPFWQDIQLGRLLLAWQPAAKPAEAQPNDILFDPQALATALPWLPLSLRIDGFSAELPCASGRCTLQGDLQALRRERALELRLNLQHDAQHLAWLAQLQGTADEASLQLDLTINQHPQLSLHSSLSNSPDGQLWQGTLSAPELNEAAALHSWLSVWALAPGLQLPNLPSAAQLAANWQLLLPPGALTLQRLYSASGQFEAAATLPAPWAIPGIGQLQGNLDIAARGEQGQWFAERLTADLQLDQLAPAWLGDLPPALHNDSLHLRIQPSAPLGGLPANLQGRALPLAINLRSDGATTLELQAQLALANAPPWAVHLADAQLTASNPGIAFADWKTRDLKAALKLNGYLDDQQLELKLLKGSQLNLGELASDELRLSQLSGSTDGLQLHAQHQAGSLQTWRLQGPITLATQRLEQAALKPQGWHWHGQLAATQEQVELNGQLSSAADLQLRLQLQHSANRGLQAQAQLPELFLRAGNPLASTLADWPALLDLNNGRLSADAHLSQAPNGSAPSVQLDLSGKGLAGIYDRTELTGLDGRLHLELNPRQLDIELVNLSLEQANPGIPIGPLQLRGRYSAPISRLDKGQLHVQQAQAMLLGGTAQLAPDRWNLRQDSLLFPLELRGLKLDRLFTLYPTEGLAGNGTLDGQLPLRISSGGIEIAQGQMAARPPGGRLQFDSERIRALGQSNPAMQLVTQSLEDFHFTTLNSQVNYDQQGTLSLAMRLEGQNPAIEQGRPIHFNINLQEDIPSLLASLQLTDKVSEIIKQRVQQRILQRRAAAIPKGP